MKCSFDISNFLEKISAAAAAAAAKSFQLCPTLCDPIDSSPPDSPSLGFSRQENWSGLPFPSPGDILLTQGSSPSLLHWQAESSPLSHQGELPLRRLLLLLLSRSSHVQLCATPETAAHQAPPSLGFSRQEHWSGLPFPSPMHESEK